MLVIGSLAIAADAPKYDYRVLATTKTSTMEREMSEAADAGYQFQAVMGGETAGGHEVVVVMGKAAVAASPAKRAYKLLATSKTSTMQKEIQQAADEGFVYVGQTIFESGLSGREVAIIMERDPDSGAKRFEYRLLATQRTSTMQKELNDLGQGGFRLAGLTVGKTAFGGSELLSILERAGQ